jgi:ATP-dependent Clp protease ATP-binding subunit ClpC
MTGYNFSDSVRRTFLEAQELAQGLAGPVVTPEHLLLALISPDSESFSQLLEDLNLAAAPIADIRSAIRDRLRQLPRDQDRSGGLAFTKGAMHLIELAMTEARELRHGSVEKEHLLVGYLRSREGQTPDELAAAGITVESVRPWVRRRFAQYPEA